MLLIVAVALVAGIAAAVAVLAFAGGGGAEEAGATRSKPLAGRPLLVIELPGKQLPAHSTAAQTFQVAQDRLEPGDIRLEVARIVAGYDRARPDRTARALNALPPNQPVVMLNLGLVERWAGDIMAAVDAWKRTRAIDLYGYYGTIADNLLHPEQSPGYPLYFPPRQFASGSPSQLRAQAQQHPDQPDRWLALAVALEQTDRAAALAAARRAAELDPTGLSSRVALLVLSFSKDRPQDTFGRLGPLLQQSDDPDGEIRFHIALLSLQLGLRDKAIGEFRQVLREHPQGPYAVFSREFARKLQQRE
jgi:tetratricopeptide (TPR) repeat protein